ncbi:hypothetical protein CLAIMM_09246 [Cladophialophora immunda]|nr:hypothetical protein CLAIMM_09246 [Cladophialophora immunda]
MIPPERLQAAPLNIKQELSGSLQKQPHSSRCQDLAQLTSLALVHMDCSMQLLANLMNQPPPSLPASSTPRHFRQCSYQLMATYYFLSDTNLPGLGTVLPPSDGQEEAEWTVKGRIENDSTMDKVRQISLDNHGVTRSQPLRTHSFMRAHESTTLAQAPKVESGTELSHRLPNQRKE